MKKIVVACDSFKGSLSSEKVCDTIREGFLSVDQNLQIVTIPIADGGEGTIEVLGAEKIFCRVKDAFFNDISSFWGKLGDFAVIELAAVAGLPMAKNPNPMIASTFGVGELIVDALNCGERNFILALGGSSTNDLGCGIACALGAKFFKKSGESFVPTGGTLSEIDSVDLSTIDVRISESHFITMCDVTNPLFGKNGAAYVFAPQKGATDEMLPLLDAGLQHASEIIENAIGRNISDIPGAGAAGGCGAGSVAFLNSELQSGIETVLSLKRFEEEIADADLVISGEGRFDSQSSGGKAVCGIASHCIKHGIPLILLCGSYLSDGARLPDGITSVFSILNRPCSLEEALREGESNLLRTSIQIAKTLNAF